MRLLHRSDAMAVGALALVLAAMPWTTYAWGDGLEFVAVASHLGIAHPTGYPLYTALLWVLFKLVPLEPYVVALALSRLALLSTGACLIAGARLMWNRQFPGREASPLPALLALGFSLSAPLLDGARTVEVYALSGAFLSALILCSLLAPSRGVLVASGVLIGCCASHHLTSLAMGPLFLWICWRGTREPRLRPFAAPALAIAVAIPLVAYGTLPLRVRGPEGHGIYWNAPASLAETLVIVRGGEYRIHQFMMAAPGVPFTASTYAEFLRGRLLGLVESAGAIHFGRGPTSLVAGLFVLVATCWGVALLLRERAWCACLLAGAALQVAFVLTYSIPDIADYHAGIHLAAFPFLLAGLSRVVEAAPHRIGMERGKATRASAALGVALAALALVSNFSDGNGEVRAIHQRWRERLLTALPPGAAVVTRGDADVYTVWHEQFTRGHRRDIVAYGANFNRFPWFRLTIEPADPRRAAVGFRPALPRSAAEFIDSLSSTAIEPLLLHGAVYTTVADPVELDLLARRYRVEPVAGLLTLEEMELLVASGAIQVAPPVLYRIDSHTPPSPPAQP